jgi:hypothetical protein
MGSTHAHPMVRTADVASLNERYAPWSIELTTPQREAQARNTETGEVIYRCEGWSQASRGQCLAAILARTLRDGLRAAAGERQS